ncbi:MAG: sigma-70 family RNA polymerase sigma factor [Ruminococcaceae bacterium]|nr:sigma-70 family RNA polymerase sigma factor [Oscillospiraceae bacterium]MBO4971201.1 sigma-70 family RNA polymerase sigma factor [Clostridia bacterium]
MNDIQIVDMIFMRSEAALEEMSDKYSSLCASVMRKVLDNDSDIEECVNDVRLAVWNSIPPNRPENLRAYLCTLSRNTALNKLKYNKRMRRNRELTVMLSELDDCLPYEDEELGAQLEKERLQGILNSFVSSLDEKTRVLFIRRYVYFESPEELSARFDISVNTINVKLHRARIKLKKILEKEGFAV